MVTPSTQFPLSGVIGIVDASEQQLDRALAAQLRCVEVRADLLQSAGLGNEQVMSVVSAAKSKGLACLFTLRHADQGGTFNASESDRVTLCEQALEAGADIIDLEHGTEASSIMLQASAPMILSYHNFNAMLNAEELASLTQAMEQQSPAAVKIIPTGSSIADAASMMAWVSSAHNNVKRIGFSMGEAGSVSRILALAHGSPVTYASFGEPVAPGQVEISSLMHKYKCGSMGLETKIIAVVGENKQHIDDYIVGQQSAAESENTMCVWVGFNLSQQTELEQHQRSMKIADIHIL